MAHRAPKETREKLGPKAMTGIPQLRGLIISMGNPAIPEKLGMGLRLLSLMPTIH